MKHPDFIDVEKLPSIYVLKTVSNDREAWFKKYKYGKLHDAADNDGALSEIQEIYFPKAKVISDHIDKLLVENAQINGLRIYFGSYGADEDLEKRGRINFIFVATNDNNDFGEYYINTDEGLGLITKTEAIKYAGNYQKTGGKRELLASTLSTEDQKNTCFETKHVWFNLQKLKELYGLIGDHLKSYDGYGLKMKLVSYTDEDEIDGVFGGKIPQSHKQRLTVSFVFIDKGMNEVYLDEKTLILRTIATIDEFAHSFIGDDSIWKELFHKPYDRTKLNKMLEVLKMEKYSDVRKRLNDLYIMDTVDPTPPPSVDNRRALDSTDK